MYKKGKTKAFPFFVVGTIGLRRNPVGAPSAGCSARPCARAVLPTLRLTGARLTCVSAQKKEGKSLPFYGGDNRARTCDLMHVKHAL